MAAIEISSEYGYVFAVALFSVVQLLSMGASVGYARKRAGVPYPYEYAEKAEAEADFDKHLFNCKQRVNQNTLEQFPLFIVTLCIGGVQHPCLTAGAGAFYLLGRQIYSSGYSTGNPEKREYGLIGYFGTLTMLGTSISTVYNLLF